MHHKQGGASSSSLQRRRYLFHGFLRPPTHSLLKSSSACLLWMGPEGRFNFLASRRGLLPIGISPSKTQSGISGHSTGTWYLLQFPISILNQFAGVLETSRELHHAGLLSVARMACLSMDRLLHHPSTITKLPIRSKNSAERAPAKICSISLRGTQRVLWSGMSSQFFYRIIASRHSHARTLSERFSLTCSLEQIFRRCPEDSCLMAWRTPNHLQQNTASAKVCLTELYNCYALNPAR